MDAMRRMRLGGAILTASSANLLVNHTVQAEASRDTTPVGRVSQELPWFWAKMSSQARSNLNQAAGKQPFRVFTGAGEPSTLGAVLKAMSDVDVVLVGETHDDQVAHQLELFMLLEATADARERGRNLALSLEMFEADVQEQLDEYINGHIRERDLLQDARPWNNYHDYRFMVEFAKDAGLKVLAANAPRRYVAACGKHGRAVLEGFPQSARAYLAPLPYPEPSAEYVTHFREEMLPAQHSDPPVKSNTASEPQAAEGCPYIGFKANDESVLDPVVLWDATMAHRIHQVLECVPDTSIYHVCGSFHCQHRLGIVEMLSKYRPSCRSLVIAIYPEDNWQDFDEADLGKGDFIILTNASAAPGNTDDEGEESSPPK